MLLKKYEKLLKELSSQIENGTFNIKKNKDKLDKINEVYNFLKSKNYDEAKNIIENLNFIKINKREKFKEKLNFNDIVSPSPSAPVPSECSFSLKEEVICFEEEDDKVGAMFEEKKESETGNWDINGNFEDDNIETFNSIEMMTEIFLNNLKNYSK